MVIPAPSEGQVSSCLAALHKLVRIASLGSKALRRTVPVLEYPGFQLGRGEDVMQRTRSRSGEGGPRGSGVDELLSYTSVP